MLFINYTGIHLFLPRTHITYLLTTSVEINILVPDTEQVQCAVSIIAYTSPSFWLYSHITSNFVFALSLISIVDYRFVQTMSEAESAIFYRNTICCCPCFFLLQCFSLYFY